MANKARVVVAGALGRMGSNAVDTFVANSDKFELVAGVVRDLANLDPKVTQEYEDKGVTLSDNLKEIIQSGSVDILVELTTPESVYANSKFALENGVRPVIGATGLSQDEINELSALSQKSQTGAIIAPNFAIGAILMMQFAKKATEYFEKYEILELHHDKKLDAPSGTAIKTAEMMEAIAKSKGRDTEIPIHSVRLPGIVANQEVIFGGLGQTLSVKHVTIDRSSFMPGILLAAEKVMQLDKLVYGLDQVL